MSQPARAGPSGENPGGRGESGRLLIESLHDDQGQRWQKGERFLVEAYLVRHPALGQDPEGLLDLIYNEVVLREQMGEAPQLDEYLGRFPQCANQLRLQFHVHEAIESSPPTSALPNQAAFDEKKQQSATLGNRGSPGDCQMNRTPVSLLEQLRQPGDQQAWKRFVQLYTPLLYHWARRVGLQSSDAADLVQDVFTVLVEKLPEFIYDPSKRFRAWLWTVTLNKWRENQRRQAKEVVAQGQDVLTTVTCPDDTAALGEAEYRQHLVKRSLQLMQSEFQPTTWKACWEYVVAGRSAAEVARELGISTNAVHLAKSRVLRRLRLELKGLLD